MVGELQVVIVILKSSWGELNKVKVSRLLIDGGVSSFLFVIVGDDGAWCFSFKL